MQIISTLCCSNSFVLSPASVSTNHRFLAPFQSKVQAPLSFQRPHLSLQNQRHAFHALRADVTEEIVENTEGELQFVEVGYVGKVHGLQGEVRVNPETDFPELRFCKPGRRWIKQQVLGRETVQEVELVAGRGHPRQRSWILKFRGVDTVDQAKLLIGSTLLVREEDRPELEEGEFYTRDLVGMKVIHKETGESVGTVVNIFNYGANDLLHVRLDSYARMSSEAPLVWIPFVEAIVPDVDVKRREMQIVPPKGLLELNIRSNKRSKKERRQLEWKERRKFQKRFIAAKKKLCELKQDHVFHGFRFGAKAQRGSLADQIVGVNFKLLQQALQNFEIPSKRWNKTEVVSSMMAGLLRNVIRISQGCLSAPTKEKLGSNFKFLEKGLSLTSKGKVGIVLVANDNENWRNGCNQHHFDNEITGNSVNWLQDLLLKDCGFVKVEDRASVPLVVISAAQGMQPVNNLFSDNNHFGFDAEKVLLLEEEKLPVISNSLEEQSKHRILMRTPWEILQSPIGSGGVISLLSSNNIVEKFCEIGVEYIKICSTGWDSVSGNTLLGFVSFHEADIGIQLSASADDLREDVDMIFSMNFLKKLTNRIDKLQFHAIPKANSHVVKVDKDWVDVIASSPNSYEFHSSIYSSLNACSLDKVLIMEITD